MRGNLYRSASLVMIGIAVSNATGFVREMVIAHQFGATRLTDIYLIAFAIPEFFFVMLPIVVNAALVPLLTERRVQQDEKSAWNFLAACALVLTAVLALLALLAIIGSPAYLRLLAPGFSEHDIDLANSMARIMLPAVALMGISAAISATLNSYEHFLVPALGVAAYNATFVAVTLTSGRIVGVKGLAWGVLLGVAAAVCLQLPQLWSHAPSRWSISLAQPVRVSEEFWQFAVPLLVGYAIHHLALLIDRAMASALPVGSIAALNYAYRTNLIVAQLFGVAVSTALFPTLAQHAVRGQTREVRRALVPGLRLILFLGLPAILGLVVLRVPLTRLLFQRGQFDAAATAMTASILPFYAWGVLADSLCHPLWRVLYAYREVRAVIWVNAVKTALRVALNVVLIPFLLYNGIALSASAGLTVQLILLVILVWRKTSRLTEGPI
jgi:putative peptidoglycan lipid II flippase